MRLAVLIVLLALRSAVAESGRWVEVVLTAYSPLDAYTRDDEHNPLRLTSIGVRTAYHPYGVAIDPTVIPYRSRIYIPPGLGYLDQTRASDRWFEADDTGPIIKARTRETGMPHLDLRYIGTTSALTFGTKRAWIYIITP